MVRLSNFPRAKMSNQPGNANSTPPPLIRLDQVAIRFGDQAVLRGINLDMARGETLVVIGESGCGKTVLLKLIVGLLWPTAGRVRFDGRVLVELDDHELTRQRLRLGFLFQNTEKFSIVEIKLAAARERGLKLNCIVDGGAHTGDWTREVKAIYPDATILAVEPRAAAAKDIARGAFARMTAKAVCVSASAVLGGEIVVAIGIAVEHEVI